MSESESSAWQSPSIGERVRSAIWLIPLLFALAELLGHAVMRGRVATDDDWRRAGEYVRPRIGPRTQVLAAPDWVEPQMRRELGDVLGLDRVGSLDLAPFDRVYLLSVRGHLPPTLEGRAPVGVRRFGEVTVARFELGPSPMLYDFVAHLEDARVERIVDGVAAPCPSVRVPGRGGGLGFGPYWPEERFVCDAERPWLFVAKTVNEDRDLRLRTCVWQHPQGDEPIRVTFPDVPLGARIVFDADIYYEHERNEVHGPVPFELRVAIDGHDVATMRHFDGQGRKRMVVASPGGARRGAVSIETTTANPHLRTICWSGRTETEHDEARR